MVRARFLRDDAALSGTASVLVVVFIIAIPLALLALVFLYLRRTAPEGTVLASEAEKPATPVAALEGHAARVKGAMKCPSCGMAVSPDRPGRGISRCPNCNTALIA